MLRVCLCRVVMLERAHIVARVSSQYLIYLWLYKSEFSAKKIFQVFTLHLRWCECGHAGDNWKSPCAPVGPRGAINPITLVYRLSVFLQAQLWWLASPMLSIYILLPVEISSTIENTKEYIKNVLRVYEEGSEVREFPEIRPDRPRISECCSPSSWTLRTCFIWDPLKR